MVLKLSAIEDDGMYRPEDVAKLLNKSRHTVRYWIWQGKLKAYKIGKCCYIYGSDLKDFLLSNPTVAVKEPSHASEHKE